MQVQDRLNNQHNRVQNGLNSGRLDGAELQAIRAQRAQNRAAWQAAKANGASREDLQAQRQQMLNGVSQSIWNFKHN